jgi:hypothetical protein
MREGGKAGMQKSRKAEKQRSRLRKNRLKTEGGKSRKAEA